MSLSKYHDGPKCGQNLLIILLINLHTTLYTSMLLHLTPNLAWHTTKTYTLVDLHRKQTYMHAGGIGSIMAACSTITLMLADVLAVFAVDEVAYWKCIPEKMCWWLM